MFVIEKNIPLQKSNKYKEAVIALASASSGDSLVFEAPSFPSPIYGMAKAAGFCVTCRGIGEGKYRIWRK